MLLVRNVRASYAISGTKFVYLLPGLTADNSDLVLDGVNLVQTAFGLYARYVIHGTDIANDVILPY